MNIQNFKLSNHTRRDLYHVCVPVMIATVMAPQTLAGSAIFLLVWVSMRVISNA